MRALRTLALLLCALAPIALPAQSAPPDGRAVLQPVTVTENVAQSAIIASGIRPGDQTSRYLERILMRLTLAGAVYVTLVCLLPEFLILKWNVPFYFGGTSLLIIVVVTMDFMAQVQAYVMTHQYDSLLKKANFKGGLTAR